MSDTTPSSEPRDRSKPKKRRFGLFNLFGFSAEPETAGSGSAGYIASLKSNRGGQGQRSGLGIADDSSDNRHNNDAASIFGEQGNPASEMACVSDSHDTALTTPIFISEGASAASNRQDHDRYPRSVSLDIPEVSSDGSSICDNPDASLPSLSLGDSQLLHERHASKSVYRESGNTGTSVSMIRTCPIPERLRLHTRDTRDHSAGINSPGPMVSSANTLTDSPRVLPDNRVHRRATVSSGGTLDTDYRNTPRTPDQSLSVKRPSVIGASPRHENQHYAGTLPPIVPGSVARRTSSNNSSWSVATPTSANDIAGNHSTPTGTPYGGYGGFLPDWEHANAEQQQQQMQAPLTPSSLRSRTKGRRYSVFDVTFANQPRPEGNASNYGYSSSAAIPTSQSIPLHNRRTHRKGSSKSSAGADTLSAHELPSFTESNTVSPRRLRSHSQTSKHFPSHPPPREDISFAPLRRSPQQSHSSISTFSSQGKMLDETSQDSGRWQHTADEQRAGSKHLFTGYQELSSGNSTPRQTPFAPTHFGQSRGKPSTSAFDVVSVHQSPKALKDDVRSSTGSIHGICWASAPEDLNANITSALHLSTSMPDISLAPDFSCFEGYAGSLKRPDYYYEQILESSRSAKAGRWRHYSPGRNRNAPAIGHGSADHASKTDKQSGGYYVSGPQALDIEAATVPFPALESACTSAHCADIDPVQNVTWHEWTDELCDRPETPVTAQARGMWQKILRNWRYRYRGGSDAFGHQNNSSASYIGDSGMQRTPKHINIANVGHDVIATGKNVGVPSSPTSNAPAILIPAEPTYLQRGSSESGRNYLPGNPLAPLYPMGSHGQVCRTRQLGVFSEYSIAGLTSATTTPQTSASDVISANGVRQNAPTTTTTLCSTADEGIQILQPAPHRRLSIIKSQELGIQRTPSKPSSSSSSQGSSNSASDKAPRSTASFQSFSGVTEKQPIVIAQLEPLDRVVDTLYSFYTRLHMRLEKAKTESESELLRIIQDLGSFVEDGLCYVNEDTDPSESDSVYGAAPVSENKTPSISGDDDDDDTHTPGLVIARKSLSDEHHKRDSKNSATGSGSHPLFFEPEMSGSSRGYARHGLESLNCRLHDMLYHHHSRVERNPGRASSAGPGSRDAHGTPASSQLGFETVNQPRPQANLVRSLSICRLAGLVASAGGIDNSHVPSADQERFSHSGKECQRAEARRLSQENKRVVDDAPDIPEFGSYKCPFDRRSAIEHSSSRTSMRSTDSRASPDASPLIEEDQFKPTPLIEAIMDLVNIIGCVINLSADDMLHPISNQLLDEALERTRETDTCFDVEEECERVLSMMPTEYLVQKLNSLGFMWQRPLLFLDNTDAEQKQPWPCRGLFFRALLAISSLNRIVMWYVAVRSTYSEDIIEQLDMRTHVSSSTDSQRQSAGLAYNRLSSDQAQSDTASVSGVSLVDAGSPSSPEVPGPAMAYKHSAHTTTREPNVTWTATLAGGSGFYQAESSHSSAYNISGSSNADRQAYDASNLPPSNGATSLTLNTAELDKSLNMLLEVALDGRIRYISPTCRQLLGVDPESVVGLPATAIFDIEDAQVYRSAVEQLLTDSTRTVEINIRVHGPGSSNAADVEAKGMLIYSRTRNEPSHVLWVLRSVHLTLMNDSTNSWECKADLAENNDLMQTFEPITCRICDMSVPAAYFEKHTWLCAKSHRAAMDVCRQNDRLSDLRTEIQAWYPGCDIDDLEAHVHGELDSRALHTKAKLKAAEFGDPVWENLVSEAAAVTRSMVDVCLNAMAIDEKDAVPKCELPGPAGRESDANPSRVADNSRDFVRSHLWKKVADYQTPLPEYTDASLHAIQALLFGAIRAKLGAIDALQYAIIDSSVALSRWVPSESEYMEQDAPLHAEQQLPLDDQDADAVVTSDYAESSSLQHPLPGNSQSKCGNSDLSSASPAISRASAELDAVSSPDQLRIVTKDLHPVPSRSQTRSSISSNALLATPTMPTIDDFELLKPISKGAYGSVYLAKKRTTGEYYAIKALRKADMIAKNQISNVKAERAIMMAQTGSPFVVRLLYTFQSRTNLYLVMEYLNGGDCASLLKAIGTLPEDWARQYLAEVVLGVQDLHARDVVHRDLKPDNLLIDSEGHLKLTDFGLSRLGFLGRRVDQQTVGSPLQADESPARQPRTQEAANAFVVGSIPNLAQALPSAIPYSIYSQGTVGGFKAAYDEGHLGNVPSITTPPTIKSDTYHHNSAYSGHNSAHGPQVSSAYNSDTFIPTADDISSKHPPALKPASNQSSLSDSNGGCVAPSLSSTSSSQSVGFGTVSIPSHHKHALGTPDYIAPESILGLEAGKSVDWWALGIICYEFIFGIPPFHDDTPEKVFKNILSSDIDFYDDLRGKLGLKDDVRNSCGSGFDEDEYDDGEPDVPLISPETRDFITKLLCRDPKRRLGYNGADEVKAHPMFRGVDWGTILETQASFVPNVENIESTDYFDPRGATMDDQEPMDRLEGKPDSPSIGGSLIRDTCQPVVPRPQLGIDAGSDVSKSHETHFDISKYVSRAPLNRAKTLPAIPGNDGIRSETNSGTISGSQVLSPEPPTSRSVRDLDSSDGQKYRQPLSSVDATPGSEFGVFTFKNLHVLEQANMNELVKLRRRSTMLDVSAAPASHPTTRASYSFGPSSPTSPSPLALNVQQCPHAGIPFGGGIGNNSSALQPYQTETLPPARTFISTQTPPHDTRQDHWSQKDNRLALAGTLSETPLSAMAAAPGSLQLQHVHSHRGSLLNPNTQLPSHGQKSLVVPHGISVYRPTTTSELLSDTRKPNNAPNESVCMRSTVCLVADDNPVCCKVMEVMLQRLHLQCVIVRNGAEALRIAMGRTAFRAIFMDAGMPIVDGNEATRMIKSTYNINKDTPVISMTAYEGEAADTLYDGSIVKPATLSCVKKSLGYTD